MTRSSKPKADRRRTRAGDYDRHDGPDQQEQELLNRAYGMWAADREEDQ